MLQGVLGWRHELWYLIDLALSSAEVPGDASLEDMGVETAGCVLADSVVSSIMVAGAQLASNLSGVLLVETMMDVQGTTRSKLSRLVAPDVGFLRFYLNAHSAVRNSDSGTRTSVL